MREYARHLLSLATHHHPRRPPPLVPRCVYHVVAIPPPKAREYPLPPRNEIWRAPDRSAPTPDPTHDIHGWRATPITRQTRPRTFRP